MRSEFLILCLLENKNLENWEFTLILEILIEPLIKMNIICYMLINDASGHQIISYIDGIVGYNQIFIVESVYLKLLSFVPV